MTSGSPAPSEPPPAGPVPFRPGAGPVVGGIVVGLVLSSLVGNVVVAATGDRELGLGGRALVALGLWAGLVGAAVLASRRKGSGSLGADLGLRIRPVDGPLGVGAGLVSQVVVVPLVALLLRPVLGRPDVETPARELLTSATGPGLLILVMMVLLGAPLVEELFYRGLVLRALAARWGAPWAVAGSAVLFGVSHQNPLSLQGVILVMASLAAFGVVLGTLAVRTGRLGPAVFGHASFNAVTVLTVLFV